MVAANTTEKKEVHEVPADEFIKLWQSSSSLEDMEEKTGMKRANLQTRAYKYACMGIPIKVLKSKRKRGLDVEALKNLALGK